MNIVLFGFMGTGKSAVSKLLAEKLDMKYVSLDQMIVEHEKMPISKIFSLKGESFFREIERMIVQKASDFDNCVIDTGGGVVLNEDNIVDLGKNGILICLTATIDTILARTQKENHRPLLNVDDPRKKIQDLLATREPFYKKIPHSIDTSDLSLDEVVGEILNIKSKASG